MNYRIFLICLCLFVCSVSGGTVNENLEKECKDNPDKKVNLMLDLPSIEDSLPSLFTENDAVRTLRKSLRELTARSQESLAAAIKEIDPNSKLQHFWIVNRIGVRDVSCSTANKISSLPMEFGARLEEVAQLFSIGTAKVTAEGGGATTNAIGDPQWGIKKINATAVWNVTRGKGVIVANIDTGVRGSHDALKGNWRKEFGWLDGYKNSSTDAPNDDNGHGTHTMGTICGQKGVGVAPDAQWIACKGCNSQGCPEAALLTCGQWILCPYSADANGQNAKSDCSMRPRVVSNSWGGIGGASFYNGVIEQWRKAGIIPIFAIGNEGPVCGTTGSPGNQNDVIAVGSTTIDDNLSDFSSRGPYTSIRNLVKTKPEISAPGSDILSTWNTADNAYATISGTSMATPHVAGATALLLSEYSSLTYGQVFTAFTEHAYKKPLTLLDSVNTCSCVGPLCRAIKPDYPNNGWGHGRLDVLASFNSIKGLRQRK